ncbi:hypothetical protein [Micromonospora endolithica]|uniref:Uncharacterized protein n=1 Tax=Micromonospora endolithica TaxID=230091 RepID=A0A3A9ZMS3_9ACTN|nr:hypothetical protein [Micromonospora endolithica]RKN49573.1 hypothetical protein D7223_08890 [Micromonospora endolithica]TWJ23794.1 hypothetical protein JD76_03937 [Micromonospora endolithica]
MRPHKVSRRFGVRASVLVLGLVGAAVLVPASPASAAVPGLVRVSAVSANNSNDFHTVTAVCPAGKVLTGTGYEINGATGEAVVDDLRPNGGPAVAPTAVTATAYEAEPFAGNWSVTAYAICANPVAGLVRVSVTGANTSADFRTTTATCPAGKVLTGTGYEMVGVTGEGIVDDFRPNGGPAAAPTAVTVGAYEAEAFAGSWTLTAYAICANPLAGLVRVSLTSPSNSNDFRGVTATCPAGKRLTGAGYELNGATGEVVVDDFRPNGGAAVAPTSDTSGAYEEDPLAGNWTNTSYAICATA